MSTPHDITVRKVKFDFPDELDDVLPGNDLVRETYMVAFSLTMPYLEPYLIRSFRSVADDITDAGLAADVREFIGQEAQHFQNHRRINEIIKRQLGPAVAAELQTIVQQYGGSPEESGSASAAMHRGWVAVKGTLSGYSDKAILEETERGEDVALESYRKALAENLPADVRSVVERQYEGVKRNHTQVRQLRDRARAAST